MSKEVSPSLNRSPFEFPVFVNFGDLEKQYPSFDHTEVSICSHKEKASVISSLEAGKGWAAIFFFHRNLILQNGFSVDDDYLVEVQYADK